MFTGIIEATATVQKKTDTMLVLERPRSFADLKIGASIAVSGACLSVTAFDDHSMTFSVIPETLAKTKLGQLAKGDHVNLERAMRADGRFDGHIVQGHVEGVAKVSDLSPTNVLTVQMPKNLLPFIIHKGSITLDGVSLTVVAIAEDQCSVALIPLTLTETTLGSLQKGDSVNVETDLIGRYIHSFLPTSR